MGPTMVSSAKQMSPEEWRALQIACFSLLPGLGQLVNKRADKAIAFFAINALNITIVSVFARLPLPYLQFYESEWVRYMHYWNVGSAPFAILMFLIAAYTSYAMYDAYKDALDDSRQSPLEQAYKSSSFAVLRAIEAAPAQGYAFRRWRKPLITLSLITCFSYIVHLGTIMLACFLVLLKVFPLEPIVREHAIEFVIADLDDSSNSRHEGQGELRKDVLKDAHSPDPIRDKLAASTKGAESGSRVDDAKKDATIKETEQLSSKQIINPDAKQSPKESRSSGASDTAKMTTKTKDAETQLRLSAATSSDARSTQTAKNQQAIEENGKQASVQQDSDSSNTQSKTMRSSPDPFDQLSNPSQTFVRGGMASLVDPIKASNSSSAAARAASGQMSQTDLTSGMRTEDPKQRSVEAASFVASSAAQLGGMPAQQKAVSIAMVSGTRGLRSTSAAARARNYENPYSTYEATIDNSVGADAELSPVWNRYFRSFQNAHQRYSGEMSPGRADAEIVFDSKGTPVSYNIKNESSPASDSLNQILSGMNMSALPSLPAKFNGKLSVKMGVIHSGKHTIATFDVSPNKSFANALAPRPVPVKIAPLNNSQANSQGTGETQDARSPSMLGFMDEALSADPSMQHFWSEYSKVLSHVVRDRAIPFSSGSTIASFAVDRSGEPLRPKLTNPESEISRQLSTMLNSLRVSSEKLPTLPAKNVGKTYMAVKLSTKNEKPFVSVEIQANPIQLNDEALSTFESEAQLQAYLQDLKKVIYRSWNPRSKEGSKPVMVGFHIATNGRISNHKVVQSSGDPETDKAALDAALSVTEWVAPPAGTEEDLDISMVIQNCTPCDETKTGENAHKKRITLPIITEDQNRSPQNLDLTF